MTKRYKLPYIKRVSQGFAIYNFCQILEHHRKYDGRPPVSEQRNPCLVRQQKLLDLRFSAQHLIHAMNQRMAVIDFIVPIAGNYQ